MADSKRFQDWLDKAGKDLEAARILRLHLCQPYYIETRYPADFPLEVSDEEALECLAIAERIYEHIDSTTQAT
ncbi:MAG: HEPN domain-containing protein [Syntrophomonas sp.]